MDEGFVHYLDDLVWLRPVATVANAGSPPLQPPPSRPEAKEAKVAYPFRDASFASATDDGRGGHEKDDGCTAEMGPRLRGNGEATNPAKPGKPPEVDEPEGEVVW